MQRDTPRNSIGNWINPTRVFIAVLIVAAYWLAPVIYAPKEKQEPVISSSLVSAGEDAYTKAFPGDLMVASA